MAKITSNKVEPGKKKDKKDAIKIAVMVGVGFAIFLGLVFGYLILTNKKSKEAKKINYSDSANATSVKQTGTQAPAPNGIPNQNGDNQVDTSKLGKSTDDLKQKNAYTQEQLKSMSREERSKVISNSLNNNQEAKPQEIISIDQVENQKMKLDFNPKGILTKKDFINYEKRITKMEDRTFTLWLDCTYKGKPYKIITKSEMWNDLDDSGIVPVILEYYIDKSQKENILSINIEDGYKVNKK